jgi:hypothetical protein
MIYQDIDQSPREIVCGILNIYPDLTYGGIVIGDYRKIGLEERAAEIRRAREAMLTSAALDQFERCRLWLENQPRTRKVHPKSGNSYSLKEEVERQSGGYVSNGMFIAAAIACGYKVARAGYNSPHAWLNIGQLRPTNPNLCILSSKRDPSAPPSRRPPRIMPGRP